MFRKKGYEGASLSDLTRAMGIHRPSLYAAFGNKEALFRKALDRYGERTRFERALEEATARAVAEVLLRSAAEIQTDRGGARGCLMVKAALSSGAGGAIRNDVCSRRAALEAKLRRRFERARREGDLPPRASPADLARFLLTVIGGMAVQAAAGASRRSLRRIAFLALEAWPAR